MARLALVTTVLCIVMAVVVFVFTDGPRRCYSGIFFAIMGVVMLANFLRWRHVGSG